MTHKPFNEQRQDSLEELSRIAYDLIRQSGLYKEPRAKDWDQLADEWAVQLLAKVDELDSEEWTRIESEKERGNLFEELERKTRRGRETLNAY